MKIVMTFEEAKWVILNSLPSHYGSGPMAVTFIHKDESGESDITDVASIDRVEVTFRDGAATQQDIRSGALGLAGTLGSYEAKGLSR